MRRRVIVSVCALLASAVAAAPSLARAQATGAPEQRLRQQHGRQRVGVDRSDQQLHHQLDDHRHDQPRSRGDHDGPGTVAEGQGAGAQGQQQVAAEQQAAAQAATPVLMDLAKGAARQAITQNLAVPLKVAGFSDVRVTVRFDGEPIQP